MHHSLWSRWWFRHRLSKRQSLPICLNKNQGCALRKIEGSPVVWNCKIYGTQHMISMKNLRFSSRRRVKVRRQGPPGSARAQPGSYFWLSLPRRPYSTNFYYIKKSSARSDWSITHLLFARGWMVKKASALLSCLVASRVQLFKQ